MSVCHRLAVIKTASSTLSLINALTYWLSCRQTARNCHRNT